MFVSLNDLGVGAKFSHNFLRPAPQTGLSPRSYLTIVMIKLKVWPAAGFEAKVVA